MKTGCLLGAAAPPALRFIFRIGDAVLQILGKIIFNLGLFIPLIYLAYGGILRLVFKLHIFDLSQNSVLYIVGLILSIIAAVIYAVRRGISRFSSYRQSKNVVEYSGKKLSHSAPEAPKIYRSKVNRGIVVYEYDNRYDLYEEVDDGLLYRTSEYKDVHGRRS